MGFCYRTSASGLPFDNSTYGINIGNFTGIRQQYNKYSISGGYTLDETQLLRNKTDMEAWITFSFSCRTSGTTCNEFDFLSPVTTGFTTISGSCAGSYINADFACGDSVARPDNTYFTTENITGIQVLYSGLSNNVYPFIKLDNVSSGNVYTASRNQVIYINYTGVSNPDNFRSWVNSKFNFVELDNNIITRKWPGVDLYWSKNPNNQNIAWARLIPCDSAAFESSLAGIYIFAVNNIRIWEANGQSGTEFLGQYAHDSNNNRYINVNDDSIQIRFIEDKWHLGKIVSNALQTYYILELTTGGVPQLLDPEFVDYSDYSSSPLSTWNETALPTTCTTLPIGSWTSVGYLGTGNAISIKDPMPLAYNENNPCN
jgi:hypothetical protein